MKKIKKTFELGETVVDTIKNISEYFNLNEVEIVEMAILQPKLYITSLKVFYRKKNE